MILGGCHGPDEKRGFAELCEIVEEAVALYRADGKPLPQPTAGRDFANKMQDMARSHFPLQYEVEERLRGMTALGGLPLFMEFARRMDLPQLIAHHVRVRMGNQGWCDEQMIMAVMVLNLAGGDCVDDVRILEGDEGFCRVFRAIEDYGRTESERRALKRSRRKPRTRTFPSPTALREFLELFHDPEQEKQRRPHKAFIPEPSDLLLGLVLLNAAFAAQVQRRSPRTTATLDMDATVVETFKKAAFYCYKKFKAYQPLNVYWAEPRIASWQFVKR